MTTEPIQPSDENTSHDTAPAPPGACGPADSAGAPADAVENPAHDAGAGSRDAAPRPGRGPGKKLTARLTPLQRGKADLANARRRHDEERISIQQQANSRLLVQLLPIVDELDLALNHLEANSEAACAKPASASWAEGVRLIHRKLSGFLEAQGVKKIEVVRRAFQPGTARSRWPGPSRKTPQSGHIVEVLRQGYRLHDRVVQVAQVVVNQ